MSEGRIEGNVQVYLYTRCGSFWLYSVALGPSMVGHPWSSRQRFQLLDDKTLKDLVVAKLSTP